MRPDDDEQTPLYAKRRSLLNDAAPPLSPQPNIVLLNQIAALDTTLFTTMMQLLAIEPYHLPAPTVPAIERASSLLEYVHRIHGSLARAQYAVNHILAATTGHPFHISAQDPTVLEGRCVSGHELQRFIGRGGTGTVYHAQKLSTREPCAFKIIDPLPHDAIHILGETRDTIFGLNSIHHPSLIRIRDFATARLEDGGPPEPHSAISYYMTMEFIEGCNLGDWIRAAPGQGRRLLEVLIHLTEALALCHEARFEARSGVRRRGFFHGDIKPSNVVMRGDTGIPVLLDFMLPAIHQMLEKPRIDDRHCTENLGTPGYMAPEQAQRGLLSELCDIYSLGVTTLQLCRLCDHWSDLTMALTTLGNMMTRHAARERPQSMLELCESLRSFSALSDQ